MSNPELASLEHLITERSYGQAEVIAKEIFDQLRKELTAATGQDLAKIDFQGLTLSQHLSEISKYVTHLMAQHGSRNGDRDHSPQQDPKNLDKVPQMIADSERLFLDSAVPGPGAVGSSTIRELRPGLLARASDSLSGTLVHRWAGL
jgi:hypothetical protein